jgi:hypothetical protein
VVKDYALNEKLLSGISPLNNIGKAGGNGIRENDAVYWVSRG